MGHAGSERLAERRGKFRILQDQRALEVPIAVQSGRETEVPFEQRTRLPEQIENSFRVHYVAFPLCVVRKLSSNNFRMRLYSSAQLDASVKP